MAKYMDVEGKIFNSEGAIDGFVKIERNSIYEEK
jgi:hypothetical protein